MVVLTESGAERTSTMTLSKEVERMTHTTAKEAAIHKVNMRMAQKHNYREMAEKGLSQEAKKYRDSYIKHKEMISNAKQTRTMGTASETGSATECQDRNDQGANP